MTDISLAAYTSDGGWSPIGPGESFMGIFDGNGHKITGLYINRADDDLGQGLFRQNYGTIRNLTVEGNVTGGNEAVGLLASMNYARISNCSTEGKVSGKSAAGWDASIWQLVQGQYPKLIGVGGQN